MHASDDTIWTSDDIMIATVKNLVILMDSDCSESDSDSDSITIGDDDIHADAYKIICRLVAAKSTFKIDMSAVPKILSGTSVRAYDSWLFMS